ncbi:hypothetical protein MMPV_000888 [Pyropia vietnamensis]
MRSGSSAVVDASALSSSRYLRVYYGLALLLLAFAATGWAGTATDQACAARFAAAERITAEAVANGTATAAATAALTAEVAAADPSAAIAEAVAAVAPPDGGAAAGSAAAAMAAMSEGHRLPPCASTGRARSFLIVFMGHSGSTALLSEMTQHADIMGSPTGPEPVDHYEYETNTSLALAFTRRFLADGIATGKVPGFKLRPTHILADPDGFRSLVREYGVRIIWNSRLNLLKQAVGEYRARVLKDLSVVEGLRDGQTLAQRCAAGDCAPVNISDMPYFVNLLRDLYHSDALVEEAVAAMAPDGCVLPVPYEDYLYGRATTMGRVYRFLGLPVEDHPPNRHKATHDSLCAAVANYGDLCAALYPCRSLRWMFDDWRTGCKCGGHLAVSTWAAGQAVCDMGLPQESEALVADV